MLDSEWTAKTSKSLQIALNPIKFIYSEKATKFCEISTLLLTVCTVVKSKVEILQNFVAFSEYMNFNIGNRTQQLPIEGKNQRSFANITEGPGLSRKALERTSQNLSSLSCFQKPGYFFYFNF